MLKLRKETSFQAIPDWLALPVSQQLPLRKVLESLKRPHGEREREGEIEPE